MCYYLVISHQILIMISGDSCKRDLGTRCNLRFQVAPQSMYFHCVLNLFVWKLEEMHNIHSKIKEECKNKNWEACQMFNEQHELMDCFNEESKMQNQLVLELHKAKGKQAKLPSNGSWTWPQLYDDEENS